MGGNHSDTITHEGGPEPPIQVDGTEFDGKMTGSQADLAINSQDFPSENKPIEFGDNTAQPTADKMPEHDIKYESTEVRAGDREGGVQDTQLPTEKINGSQEVKINESQKVDVSQGVLCRIIGHVYLPPGESLLSSLHDRSSLAQMDTGHKQVQNREAIQNNGLSQADAGCEGVQIEIEGTLPLPLQDVPCEISEINSNTPQTLEESIVCQESLCSPLPPGESQCQIDSYTRSEATSASINNISSSNTISDALSTNISSYQSKHTQMMCSSQGTQENTIYQNEDLIADQQIMNSGGFKNNLSNIESCFSQIEPSTSQDKSSSPPYIQSSLETAPGQNKPSADQMDSNAVKNGPSSAQISCVLETSASSMECLSTVNENNQSLSSVNQSNLDAGSPGVKNNHQTNNPPSQQAIQGQSNMGKLEIDGISRQNETCEPGLAQDNEINMSQMERKSSFKTSANSLEPEPNPSEKVESGIPGPVLHRESGKSPSVGERSGISGPLLDGKSGISGSLLDSLSNTYLGDVSEEVVRAELPQRGSQNQTAEHGMTFVPEIKHENNMRSVESHCSKTDMMSVTCREPEGGSGEGDTSVIKSSLVISECEDLHQETLIPTAGHETRADDPPHCNGMQLNISRSCLTQSQSQAVNPNSCPMKGDESIDIVSPTLNAASGKESYQDIVSGSQEGKGTSAEQMSASQKDTGNSQEMSPPQQGEGTSQKGTGTSAEQMSACQKGEGNSQEFASAYQLLSDILDATISQIEEAVRISGNSLHLNTWTSDTMQGKQSESQGQLEGQGRMSRSHGSDSNLVSCLHHSTQQRYETQAREPLNVSFASPLTEHHTYSPCPSPSPTSTIDLYDDEPIELSRSEVAAYFENVDAGNGGEQNMDIDLSCSEMERESPQLYHDVCSNENRTGNVNQNVNADNMFQPIQKPPRFQAGLPTYVSTTTHASVPERNQVVRQKSLSPHATRPQTSRETKGLAGENYHNLNSASSHYAAHFSKGSESAFHQISHGKTENVSEIPQTAQQPVSHSMDIQHVSQNAQTTRHSVEFQNGKIQHVSQTAQQPAFQNINIETASGSQKELNQETKLLHNYGSQQEFNSESKLSTDYGNKIENPKIAVEDLPLNGSCELYDSSQVRDNLQGIEACNDLPRPGQAECEPSIPVLCNSDIPIENPENNVPCSDRSVSPELFSQNEPIAHEGPDKLPIVHGSPQQNLNDPAAFASPGKVQPDETSRSLETSISRADKMQPQLQSEGKSLTNEIPLHYTSEDKSCQPYGTVNQSVNPASDPAQSHTIIDQGNAMSSQHVGSRKPDLAQAAVGTSETSQPQEVPVQSNGTAKSVVCKIGGITESKTPCKTQTDTQCNLNPDSGPPELKQTQTRPLGCSQTSPGLMVKYQTSPGPKEEHQTSSIDPQTSSIDPLPCSAELFTPSTDPQSNDFPVCKGNPKLAQASLNVPDMSSQNISTEQEAKTGPGRRDLFQNNSSLNNDVRTRSATDGPDSYQNSQGENPDVHNESGDLFVSQSDGMESQPPGHVFQQPNGHGYVKFTLFQHFLVMFPKHYFFHNFHNYWSNIHVILSSYVLNKN